jgi:hypothetical protein
MSAYGLVSARARNSVVASGSDSSDGARDERPAGAPDPDAVHDSRPVHDPARERRRADELTIGVELEQRLFVGSADRLGHGARFLPREKRGAPC